MKNKRVKRASGLIGLIFLLTCLLSLVSPIFAEEGSTGSSWQTILESEKYKDFMNPDAPESFATSPNPTETDGDTPVLLCEENELLTFQSYDNQKTESNGGSSKLYVTNERQNSTDQVNVSGDLVENLKETTAGIYGLNGVQGVAFDPDKTGRKDHVAFVGIGTDKVPYLVIYNAVNKTWSGKTKINTSMDWLNVSGTDAYQLKDVLSITAGDYNRDFRDTVVVFASFYGTNQDIFEFQVDDLTISQISNGQNGAALLHPYYKEYPSYFYEKSNKTGCNQIHAQLETGDVNNDGVDDLVCLSWMNKPDNMTDNVFYYRTMSPYLNAALGSTTATTVLDGDFSEKGQYIDSGDSIQNDNSRSTNTMYAPGFAIGAFDESGDNTIVVAGRGNTLTTKMNEDTCDSYQLADWVNVATVSLNPNGTMLTPTFSTEAISSMNELTSHTAMDKDAICSSTLEAVAFDGLDSADYLFFDGDIYSMASGTLELVQAFGTSQKSDSENNKWGDYGDITYISSSAIGNFDGKEGFYETIYFTLMTKNDPNQDDYHCRTAQIYKERVPITNQIAWGCTETAPIDLYDKGDNFDQGLTDIVVAIDNDDDGTLLKYKDKQCYYSDPEILTILQASPYFDDLNRTGKNGLQGIGNCGITISESCGKSYEEEGSHDLSVGFVSNCGSENTQMNEPDNSASYVRKMTKGWKNSMEYEYNLSFESDSEDQVVMYRTPIYVYSYYVWDEDTHDWLFDENDLFMSYVSQRPLYTQMSVNDYDAFAKAYNEGMAEKTAELEAQSETNIADYVELTTIGDSDYAYLFGHSGDPYGYQNSEGRTVSLNPIELGKSGGSESSDITLCSKKTSYNSEPNTYSLATEQRWSVGESRWSLGFAIELSDSWTNSSSNTQGVGLSYSYSVSNIYGADFETYGYNQALYDQYNFTWEAKVYDTDIPGKPLPITYELNKGEKPVTTDTVQILGFRTYNVSSAPTPPKVSLIAQYLPDTDAYKITWEKSAEANQGYRVLRLVNPSTYQYVAVDRVSKNTTSYIFDIPDDDSVGYYIFAVQSLRGETAFNVTAGLRSDNIIGKNPSFSVSVGEQSGTLSYLTAGDVTFAVSYTDFIQTPSAQEVVWTEGAAPTGVTTSFEGTDKDTLKMTTSAETPAGSYTFNVKAKHGSDGDEYTSAQATLTVGKITPASGDFTFITPASLIFDDSAKPVTVVPKNIKDVKVVTGMGEVTVEYSGDQGTTWTQEAPKAIGTYLVRINVAEGDNYTAATGITKSDWKFSIIEDPATHVHHYVKDTSKSYDATETEDGLLVETCHKCGETMTTVLPSTHTKQKETDPKADQLETKAVTKADVAVESATVNNSKSDILASDAFSQEEKQEIAEGAEAKLTVNIEGISSAATKNLIEEKAAEVADQDAEIIYVDVTLTKQVGDGEVTQVKEINTPISVTIRIPESMYKDEFGQIIEGRKIKVVRVHNGEEVSVIENGTFNPETGEYTFTTSEFSSYGITYTDAAVQMTLKKDGVAVTEIEMENGETAQLSAELTPAPNGTPAIEWKSGNEDVVKVDTKGKITVDDEASGTCVITASLKEDPRVAAALTITVKAKYTVTFESNCQTEVKAQRITSGKVSEEPDSSKLSKKGYVFKEWQIVNSEGELVKYDFKNVVTSDITLYAKWLKCITVSSVSDSKVYDGTPLTNSDCWVDKSELIEGDTFNGAATGSVTNVKDSAVENTIKDENIHFIREGEDVTGDYYITKNPGSLSINPRTVYLVSQNAWKVYDGTALTAPEVYGSMMFTPVDAVFAAQVRNLKAYGTITNVNDSPVTNSIGFTAPNDQYFESNFTIYKVEGKLWVTESNKLVVMAQSYTGKYDGETIGWNAEVNIKQGTTVSYSTDGGKTWKKEAPSITKAGRIDVKVKAENSNYETAYCEYTLEILPREITFTSGSASKVYDGKALTCDTFTETGDGFAKGEGYTYQITGSRKDVGSSANTFSYKLTNGALKDNYNITCVEGTLTVTEAPITKVTITIKAEGKGQVAPEKTVEVEKGQDQTFTFTPDKGYIVEEVKVGDQDVTADVVNNTYTITNVQQAQTITVSFGLLGDADADATINNVDALYALRHYVQENILSGKAFRRADVNKDQEVNSSDALQILRYYVGEIKAF